MSVRARRDLLFAGLALGALAWLLAGDARLPVFGWCANVLQVGLLGLAAGGAWSSATRLGPDSPASAAWRLLAAGFTAFGVAEGLDAWYEVALRVPRPFPSLADVFFLGGYLLLVPAMAGFIRAYRGSGFEVGSRAQHIAIGLLAYGAGILAGWGPLHAIASGSAPWSERALSLAYPLLDFVMLAVALVLLRIAAVFRGGYVWRVWGLLLAGLAFTGAADLVFAFLTAGGLSVSRGLMETLYLLSYLALARGVLCERELLA
jgi:hypothetical protein